MRMISESLEKKALDLVSIKAVPVDSPQLLKLLDNLFEAIKINKNSFVRVTEFTEKWNSFVESQKQQEILQKESKKEDIFEQS
jgi:hypothetical protein